MVRTLDFQSKGSNSLSAKRSTELFILLKSMKWLLGFVGDLVVNSKKFCG